MKQSLKQCSSQGVRWAMVRACAVLIVLGAMLGSTQAAFAQQAVPAKPAAVAAVSPQTAAVPPVVRPVAEEEEATAKPSKPGGDGIKVHGHWVMDIKNPDGTLVKHLDFENSLVTGGATGKTEESTGDQILAALLSGTGVVTDPGIYFVGFTPALATFPANSDISGICYTVLTATCGIFTTQQSEINLEQEVIPLEWGLVPKVNFSPTVSWVMSGNFTIPYNMTSLTAVQTFLPLCLANNKYLSTGTLLLAGSGWSDLGAGSLTSSSCNGSNIAALQTGVAFGPLTSTLVPNAPLTIVPGQVIQVTVTISFS